MESSCVSIRSGIDIDACIVQVVDYGESAVRCCEDERFTYDLIRGIRGRGASRASHIGEEPHPCPAESRARASCFRRRKDARPQGRRGWLLSVWLRRTRGTHRELPVVARGRRLPRRFLCSIGARKQVVDAVPRPLRSTTERTWCCLDDGRSARKARSASPTPTCATPVQGDGRKSQLSAPGFFWWSGNG